MALCLLLSGACTPSEPITLRFHARMAEQPFECGRRYENVGNDRSNATFSDLRLYVSRVRLLSHDGKETPVALTADGSFQDRDTALLDFTQPSAPCSDRRHGGHTTILGTARPSSVAGVAFDIGIPFAKNHQDASRARAPFDVTSMFWVWRNGYKFLRLDGTSTEGDRHHTFAIHVGSTGCSGGGAPTDAPQQCSAPNRAAVEVRGQSILRDGIDLSVDSLLTSMTLRGPSASDGCESSPDDPDCQGVFEALGIARARATQRSPFRAHKATP